MNKQGRSIAVILSISLLLACSSLLFAQESITITTFYPSPYGAYNELQTNKLAVGDTSGQPPANGQLYTARSVIYKPQSSFPESDVMQGELVYKSSGSDNWLYLHVGSGVWVKQGGVMSYTKYCFDDADLGSPACEPVVLGTQWQCDAGFTVEKLLGSWGTCYNFFTAAHDYFLPPRGSCRADDSSRVVGRAYVCSR